MDAALLAKKIDAAMTARMRAPPRTRPVTRAPTLLIWCCWAMVRGEGELLVV